MTIEKYIDYVKSCGHSQSMKRSFNRSEQERILKYWENNKELTVEELACYFEKKFKMPVSCQGIVTALITKTIGG